MSTSNNITELTCIVCDNKLFNYMEDFLEIQPACGSAFRTYGHYGSAITDFMDGTVTIVCICDDCLSKAISKNAVWFKGAMNDE